MEKFFENVNRMKLVLVLYLVVLPTSIYISFGFNESISAGLLYGLIYSFPATLVLFVSVFLMVPWVLIVLVFFFGIVELFEPIFKKFWRWLNK